MKHCLYLVAIFLLCISNAKAMTYEFFEGQKGERILVIAGKFDSQDTLLKFQSALNLHHPTIISFDSPGGSVVTAMKYGREIRLRGLKTAQIRRLECASACALAFVGGAIRAAEPGSIGVHQTSFSSDADFSSEVAVATVQLLTAQIIAYLSEMGVSADLLKIALATEPQDMRYLTGAEMDEFAVTSPSPLFVEKSVEDHKITPKKQPEVQTETRLVQPRPAKTADLSKPLDTRLKVETPSSSSHEYSGYSSVPRPTKKPIISSTQSSTSVERAAQRFIFLMHEAWSSNNAVAMDFIFGSYEERVSYYGNVISFGELLDDKQNFVKRWPIRAYYVDVPNLSVKCGTYCRITAKIIWYAHSPSRQAHSSGESIFEIDWNPRTNSIVSEGGTLLSVDRNANMPLHLLKLWKLEKDTCLANNRTLSGDPACGRYARIHNKLKNVGWCFETTNWKRCDGYLSEKEIYRGPVHMPDFERRDRWARMFRTRIREGVKDTEPDFDGKYKFVLIGCGTGCTGVFLVDLSIGKVHKFPLGGEENYSLQLSHSVSQNSVDAIWYSYPAGTCVQQQFVFENETWRLVKQTSKPEELATCGLL